MNSGKLSNACCIRAVPHLKEMLNAIIEDSTSQVIFLDLPSFGLSLKDSLPGWYALVHHLQTVVLDILNTSATIFTDIPLSNPLLGCVIDASF